MPAGMKGRIAPLNLCERCAQEQKQIEELRERKRQIDIAADRLQHNERRRLTESLVPSIEELRAGSWQYFENEMARTFERLGFIVEQTPYVKDHGRDAILRKDGKKYLLECKKYEEGNVSGRRDLQIFHSAIIMDRAVSGFFVTTGGFTRDAIEFSKTIPIRLIYQNDLVRMMFNSRLRATNDDAYRSMCRECGDIVGHKLRMQLSVKCRNGHEVPSPLNRESVLAASAIPCVTLPDDFFEPVPVPTQPQAREAITGNTYPIKNQLKNVGGRWNAEQKAWMVPADKAAQAKALVTAVKKNSRLAQKQPLSEGAQRFLDKGEQWVLDKLGLSISADTAATRNNERQGIRVGDRIVIRYLDDPDNKAAIYTLSHMRSDPAKGVLSVASPLGRLLLGLVEGEETEFEVSGRLRPILVVSVERLVSTAD
jgi:transcription elongation GreA/GreB family factor